MLTTNFANYCTFYPFDFFLICDLNRQRGQKKLVGGYLKPVGHSILARRDKLGLAMVNYFLHGWNYSGRTPGNFFIKPFCGTAGGVSWAAQTFCDKTPRGCLNIVPHNRQSMQAMQTYSLYVICMYVCKNNSVH